MLASIDSQKDLEVFLTQKEITLLQSKNPNRSTRNKRVHIYFCAEMRYFSHFLQAAGHSLNGIGWDFYSRKWVAAQEINVFTFISVQK